MRVLLGISLIWMLAAIPLWADLTYPAAFEVVEEAPNQFRLTLTVPLIKGRYMKARIVVPEMLETDRDPEARAGDGSLTREWLVPAKASHLPGAMFGLTGLLGTPYEVKFLLSTLDGRRHEAMLRSTRALFVVPPPPHRLALATQWLHVGLRLAILLPLLWLLLLWARPGVGARSAGFWPTLGLMVVAGLVAGWTGLMSVPAEGLSSLEWWLCRSLLALGWVLGGMGIASLLALVARLMPPRAWRRMSDVAGVITIGWGLYQAAGLVLLYGPLWGAGVARMGKLVMRVWFLPFMTDWSMGRIRLPVPALVLLVLGLIFYLRSRRSEPVRAGGRLYGLLLPVALLLVPLGPWRATNPFYTAQPLSVAEARPLVSGLLTETYLAFNLEREEAAFDALAETLTEGLITDVYLDSRRRLTTGIREGATVTVKDVTVSSLEMLPAQSVDGHSTYRCEWTVLARVEHWQHTHLRRNSYIGTLGVAVTDGNWRIARLELTDERREVISVGVPKG